ncbi:MAG TPA: WecB/TagA/CpsF family glycosyltransferase [Methylomirabilota bacterium]|nr:WecB/TagA/CpsF family glycosyltransferase [Methylomirabilota bacterium]
MAAETTFQVASPGVIQGGDALTSDRGLPRASNGAVESNETPIAILGVPFDNITFPQAIELIEKMIASRKPHYLATANVDFLVQASHDVELRRILFDAHLVICDGTPLVWASRLLGNPLPERVAGSDLVPLLIKLAAEKGYRPFFLGATEEVAEKAVRLLKEKYPTLQIAGHYSPPFNRLLEMDHEEIRKRIQESNADMLFVGFGCPKQEKWISMHYRSLGVPVSIGIGATIDFLAGKVSRAPVWMQKTGTEWLFRLAQEPKRLFGRYARDLQHFSGAIVSQWWNLKACRPRSVNAPPVSAVDTENNVLVLRAGERLDMEAVHQHRDEWEDALAQKALCLFDLSRVTFIDSTGVGLLIRLQKRARNLGRPFVLVKMSEPVQRALALMRLQDFFLSAPDLRSAELIVRINQSTRSVAWRNVPSATVPALSWSGEVTAANVDDVWEATRAHLFNAVGQRKEVSIDLSTLRFIDSSGLSVMIRARKFAAQNNITVRFSGMQPDVLNVVRLARLDEFLSLSSK